MMMIVMTIKEVVTEDLPEKVADGLVILKDIPRLQNVVGKTAIVRMMTHNLIAEVVEMEAAEMVGIQEKIQTDLFNPLHAAVRAAEIPTEDSMIAEQKADAVMETVVVGLAITKDIPMLLKEDGKVVKEAATVLMMMKEVAATVETTMAITVVHNRADEAAEKEEDGLVITKDTLKQRSVDGKAVKEKGVVLNPIAEEDFLPVVVKVIPADGLAIGKDIQERLKRVGKIEDKNILLHKKKAGNRLSVLCYNLNLKNY
jgi:hypothetical protein